MSETHAEFRARLKRERKARTEASRAALAAYYADGPLAIALERIARGEVTTIAIAADGSRTVTHGHGLDAAGRPLARA
jgi:hypothetical protein